MYLETNNDSITKPFYSRFRFLEQKILSCQFTTFSQLLTEQQSLQQICELFWQTKKNRGTVFAIGNGGSGASLSHFCLELIKNVGIPASLLVDSHLMSAIGNDCGFDEIYRLPMGIMVKENDLIIALSGSGKSPNILNSLAFAKERNASILTFTGCSPSNPMRGLGNLNIWIDSSDYSAIETLHFFILHTIIDNLILQKPEIEELKSNLPN